MYGTAWPSARRAGGLPELLEEAEKRDHRKLGAELDLFCFPDEIGSGLAVFHPKGGDHPARAGGLLAAPARGGRLLASSTRRTSPRQGLFETSGHLPYYADTMFPPMELEGADYYLKAMNCPMHNLIYRSRGRSVP